PRWRTGMLMVHVSVGAGFLLDATTPFVGQSVILCSGSRASVLAQMERQNSQNHPGRNLPETIEFVSHPPFGIEHSRLATHSRIRRPRLVDDVCLVQRQGR